jgi:hypothetical protein
MNIVDQLCIFHNLSEFMLLELITKSISKLCDFLQQSIEKIVCDNKNFARFSLFPTYILSIVSELGYLLHVHTCINNFESLLYFYINDFFVSSF